MKKRPQGFTLLEIMLVVTIIGLLLTAAIFGFRGNVEYSRRVRVQGDIQGITTQLKLYESMNGFYPTTDQGLRALAVQPDTDPKPSRWLQLFDKIPKDPWQSDYIYRCPGLKNPNGFDLYSAGPDRVPDTADDDWGGG
jgi:general secretion pathway protein G